MYLPKPFELRDRDAIREILQARSFGHLVSASESVPSGLISTAVPFVVDDELSAVRFHLSRANTHWKHLDQVKALLIVATADAYVSPRWYPSKEVHGKVVPTWNYEVIHLHGTVEINDSPEWKRALVTDLTNENEKALTEIAGGAGWTVGDAPGDFIDGQLKAIVGLTFHISAIEAKQKLSQNKNESDRAGAATGLAASARPGDNQTAFLMQPSVD